MQAAPRVSGFDKNPGRRARENLVKGVTGRFLA
jgi:hypothetical protein